MTLKQQIESHRDKASCRDCHAGLDPYGFVFERMSAVGRLQPKRKGKIIDATSTLPDGTEVDGLDGIRAWLVAQQQDEFARSVLEHAFSYALGRELHFADTEEIEAMLAYVRGNGYRARAALKAVVVRAYDAVLGGKAERALARPPRAPSPPSAPRRLPSARP